MQPLEPGHNTGFIETLPKETDWLHGGETGLAGLPTLASADWRPYAPPGEWQRDMVTLFDTDACVSYAFDDGAETWLDFCLATQSPLITAGDMAWLKDNGYVDAMGHFNTSDRFTAKMSGTSQAGNSLPAVAQSIRANGMVPESAWPNGFGQLVADPSVSGQTQANWNTYYGNTPPPAVALGEQFAARFQVNYEWVIYPGTPINDDGVRQQLQTSPLVIATAVCMPWNTDQVIQGCGAGAQHATLLINEETDGTKDILDHYDPFVKRFADNYVLTYAMRIVIQSKPVPITVSTFQHTFLSNMHRGDPAGTEVKALQQALQALKSSKTGKPYMSAGVFGPYGPSTTASVAAFQADHGIVDPGGAGVDCGPQTRAALNAALLSQ